MCSYVCMFVRLIDNDKKSLPYSVGKKDEEMKISYSI